MSKKKNNLVSVCCKASVLNDFQTGEYLCSACLNVTKVFVNARKTWTRNPVTQILKDKRMKIKETQLDKELREARD